MATSSLTDTLNTGLICLGVLGMLSAISTAFLMLFVGYKTGTWQRQYNKDIRKNPFVVLLFNLFLADHFQATGFLMSWHWYGIGDIVSDTVPCDFQGLFINFGDVSSAFFVLAIAVQTWAHIKFQRQLRFNAFVTIVVCIWCFALVLTAMGPIISTNYFVDTGAWCWVADAYKSQRLAYHYFWVFLVEFGTFIVYGFVIFELRKSSSRLHQNRVPEDQAAETHRRIQKSCLVMLCYPVAYITLTLPLAVSRMLEIRGVETSDTYRIFCGCFLVSSGWVDSVLYILTRASFLKSQGHREDDQDASTGTTARISPPEDVPQMFAQFPSPNLTSTDSIQTTRMTSMSSWTTNGSDTKVLPHHRADEPVSTMDHELFSQASRTVTLDAKI